MRVENQCKSGLLARDLLWNWSSIVCGREGSGMVPEVWKKPLWERVWPFFGSVGQRAFAHSIHALECRKEVWTAW